MFDADLHPVTVALVGAAVFLTGLGIRLAALGIETSQTTLEFGVG